MQHKILIWDNDGTITGSVNPNDGRTQAKIILPGVAESMKRSDFNFIISGFKSPESEAQNFDPTKVAARFIALMEKLPIQAAAFSPTMGGIACYVVIKKSDNQIVIQKAHEDPRYKAYVGDFKKPGIGMFVVMRDVALEKFGQTINAESSAMIGDTWHDEAAATSFGIPFIEAREIHMIKD